MKKLLWIVLLSCLLSGNAYTSCTNEFDFTWRISNDYAKFEFKSTSDKSIRLSSLTLITADSRLIKSLISESNNFTIKAFGAKNESFYIGDINKDVIKSASWSCRYNQKVIKKKSQPKPIKGIQKNDNSGWLGFSALIIIAIFIAKWANSTDSKSEKSSKHAVGSEDNFESNQDNHQSQITPPPETSIQKEDKTLAKFYNDYQIIDFNDIKSIKLKSFKKQTEVLVNKVMPCLTRLAENYPADTQVVMILISLCEKELVSEETFIEVQKNLKEMKNIGERVGLNKKLMTALHIMVG